MAQRRKQLDRISRQCLVLALALAALLPRFALAQTEPTDADAQRRYQSLRQQGRDCYRKRRYGCALERFEAAQKISPRSDMLFNIASTLDKLGLAVRAARSYRDYLSQAGVSAPPQALAHIQRRLARLLGQVGRIRLSIKPPVASVAIDGAAPLPLDEATHEFLVPPGPHDLLLSAAGYAPQRLALSVGAGEVLEQNITLRKLDQTGSLRLESRPAGARVWLNGRALGRRTPLVIEKLAAGSLRITVATDSRIGRANVTIEPSKTATLSLPLNPAAVGVKVTSEPAHAEIFVDGRPLGTTPLSATLFSGRHKLTATARGYHPASQSIVARVDGHNTAHLVLRPEPPSPFFPARTPVLPLIFHRLPVETALFSRSIGVYSDLTAANGELSLLAGVTLRYAWHRLMLQLDAQAIDHGLVLRPNYRAERATTFGALEARLRILLWGDLRQKDQPLALASFINLKSPSFWTETYQQSYGDARGGIAITALLGPLTLSGSLGPTVRIHESGATVALLLDPYIALRIHQRIALQLALQLAIPLSSDVSDQPAFALSPGLTLYFGRWFLEAGARIAAGKLSRSVFTRDAQAIAHLSVNRTF